MHRSGRKPPSAGSVSTSASPARLPATAGRSLSPADPYLLLPISTAYERPGSGRRAVAAAPDEGATAATTSTARPPAHPARGARPSSKANPAAVIRAAAAGFTPTPVPEDALHIATMCERGGSVIRGKEIPMGNWQLDPYHTQVEFSAEHLGMMTVRGYFDEVSTTADIDPDHPETAT